MRCAAASLAALALAAPAAAAPCRSQAKELPPLSPQQVASGFKKPTQVTSAFDGSGRIFVVEQAGRIRIVKDGRPLPRPFLDIRGRVRSGGEMGLLSAAFHPKHKANGRLFVNYTSGEGGLHTVVSEFKASADAADPGSERVLLTIPQPYENHNGGQVAFGPDGLLYIGMGDGGSANDPANNAQDRRSLLGKILRLDVDAAKPTAEIYALGLRNPWRFSFDPVTGALMAGDVGQDRQEEIDIVEKGGNYGWRVMEGTLCVSGAPRACSPQLYRAPLYSYDREGGNSVTGGFVYRGAALPELCGAYVFADYGSGLVWGLRQASSGRPSVRQLADTGLGISSFGIDEAWELYLVDHHAGGLYKLSAAADARP